MPTRAQDYHFTWKHITHSSRSLVGIHKGKREITVKVVDKAAERVRILAELDKLGYKLPGVND